MKNVLKVLLIIVVLIILLVNVLSILEVSFFGFRVFRIASGSMEPTLPINTLILIRKQDRYYKNDIVTYRDSSGYTTHRVVDITDEAITTKGDANAVADTPIAKESIIGKLVFKIDFFAFAMYLFKKPIFWILFFGIGMLLMFLFPVKAKLRVKRIDSI